MLLLMLQLMLLLAGPRTRLASFDLRAELTVAGSTPGHPGLGHVTCRRTNQLVLVLARLVPPVRNLAAEVLLTFDLWICSSLDEEQQW